LHRGRATHRLCRDAAQRRPQRATLPARDQGRPRPRATSSRLAVRPTTAHERPRRIVYLTGTLDAATWGAELALGEGRGRIYVVEPTGPIEDDPNLTDKKFPGNPTRSFRTRAPLRVTGELVDWVGHAPELVQAMKDGLARLAAQGIKAIED
jgi:hypothetical protein